MAAERIVIVTSGPIGSAPRVVKEADALHGAGYDVYVVWARLNARSQPFDADIISRVRWHSLPVDRRGLGTRIGRRLADRCARAAHALGLRDLRLLAHAGGEMVAPLAAAVRAVGADLVIGHNVPGIVAAWIAARDMGARLATDAEDDHVGELASTQARERALREALLRVPFKTSVFRSAASPMMASQLAGRFGVPFTSVSNAFPDAIVAGLAPPPPTLPPPSLYWCSQTIGPTRGLEGIVDVMASLPVDVTLTLRGTPHAGFLKALRARGERVGIDPRRLKHVPPALPGETARLVRGHALALSAEDRSCENRDVCLGNKIFEALLAGVPVLLSDTPAQRAFAEEIAEAGLLVDLRDATRAAAILGDWLADPQRRLAAHRAAWDVARGSASWSRQRDILVDGVRAALECR